MKSYHQGKLSLVDGIFFGCYKSVSAMKVKPYGHFLRFTYNKRVKESFMDLGKELHVKNIKHFFQNGTTRFVLYSLFYFAIIVVLIYLYSYSGVNGSGFIYNEF